MYKLGLKLWSLNTDFYFDEAKRLFKNGIYSYVELYSVPNTLDTIEKWKTLGIPFVIHAPHFAHGVNLSKPEKLKQNLELYKQAKEFADKLNAKNIIFHPGIAGDIKETARQLNIINDERILIENKPYRALPQMGGDVCTGAKIEEIKHVLENTGVGFCLDIGHASACAKSLNKETYEYLTNFMKLKPLMFHLSDTDTNSDLDSHFHFGSGNLNIAKVLSLMPQNATITIETLKDSKENLDDFIVDSKEIRKYENNNSNK